VRLAPRLRLYLRRPSPTWPEIVDAADWLRHGLDLSKPLWGEACLAMGRDRAAGVTMGDLKRPARRRRPIMSGDVCAHFALDKDALHHRSAQQSGVSHQSPCFDGLRCQYVGMV
jgi:hypothetical protein